MKDFFEMECFSITLYDLLKIIKNQKKDDSLTLKIESSYEIYLYSYKFDFEYNKDDILECLSKHLGVHVNSIFIDSDTYYVMMYFTEKN